MLLLVAGDPDLFHTFGGLTPKLKAMRYNSMKNIRKDVSLCKNNVSWMPSCLLVSGVVRPADLWRKSRCQPNVRQKETPYYGSTTVIVPKKAYLPHAGIPESSRYHAIGILTPFFPELMDYSNVFSAAKQKLWDLHVTNEGLLWPEFLGES
jgi:hypothetical protein